MLALFAPFATTDAKPASMKTACSMGLRLVSRLEPEGKIDGLEMWLQKRQIGSGESLQNMIGESATADECGHGSSLIGQELKPSPQRLRPERGRR